MLTFPHSQVHTFSPDQTHLLCLISLLQEDYRELYPRGESTSNYVFVCANPKELVVKFPMSGQHKICEE